MGSKKDKAKEKENHEKEKIEPYTGSSLIVEQREGESDDEYRERIQWRRPIKGHSYEPPLIIDDPEQLSLFPGITVSTSRRIQERWMANILHHVDVPIFNPSVEETPKRFLNMLTELTEGYAEDISWMTTFDAEGADQMIAQMNIPCFSLCEHHVLPFSGYAHIGYIPRKKIIGLSKFKRILDMYAKRLQVQERLTRQVADFIEDAIKPRGVIVVIEAEHMCMTMRGVQSPGTYTVTSAVTGDFQDQEEGSREEFMALLGRNKR